MSTPARALVLVDVQQEYVRGPLEVQHPPHEESVAQVVRALDAAEAAGLLVVVVQHATGEGAPVFDPAGEGYRLHPELERRRHDGWLPVVKQHGSVFAGTGLREQLQERGVGTVTLVGYMTNNCILASAAEAAPLGLVAEVLSDATGAISLANEAGTADARTVHTTLMTLLHSNFAGVATTEQWCRSVAEGTALPSSDLVTSAVAGRQAAGA